MNQEQTVVIGAGQAGLSASYYLNKHHVDHVILDAQDRIGDQWRDRWESLELFTPAKYNQLPGKAFPGDPWSLAEKKVVADYLEDYAESFDLPVRGNSKVERLIPWEDRFNLRLDGEEWVAEQVIVATGAFHDPYIPPCNSSLDADVPQWHSSDYNCPEEVPPGSVLVVGTGNSGIQIAEDLSSTHSVHLSGRDNMNFPRSFLGKDIYWWLDLFGLLTSSRDSWLGQQLYRKSKQGGDPIVGDSLDKRCAARDITRHPKVVDAREKTIRFEDGSSLEDVSAVIWATGFQPDFSWIEADIFKEDGYPRHKRGVVGELPGLYFLGLRWLYCGDSSLIGGVGRDARFVVRHLRSNHL